jgi:hypothetical protein
MMPPLLKSKFIYHSPSIGDESAPKRNLIFSPGFEKAVSYYKDSHIPCCGFKSYFFTDEKVKE